MSGQSVQGRTTPAHNLAATLEVFDTARTRLLAGALRAIAEAG